MTKSTITRDELNEVIATYGKHHIAHRMANVLLAAMDSEPHTDGELSNLLWYSQEATCHSDPNYYCEFHRLATPGFIASIIRELQERRKAAMDSEPVAWVSSEALDSRLAGIEAVTIPFVPGMDTPLFRHPVVTHDGDCDADLFGFARRSGDLVVIDVNGDPHVRDGMPLYRHAQPVPEMKPVGYLFVSEQGAIAYSPANWGMPGFRLIGQIYGDIDVESQPAPVVPDDVLAALQKVARIRLDMNDFDGDRRGIADCLGDAEEALIEVVNRRAAMLAAAPQEVPDGK